MLHRLVFLMHSNRASAEEIARSEQLHSSINLTAADHLAYDAVLKGFRDQYEILAQRHDAFVDSNTTSASIADLQMEVSQTRQSLASLVEAAHTQLAAGMSKEGMAKLDAFIQSEKTHMVVGVRSEQ